MLLKDDNNLIHDGRIMFGRYSGLEIGKEYLLFIKNVIDPNSIYNHLLQEGRPIENKESAMAIIQCNGIVPGLIYDYPSVAEVIGNKIEIDGQLPADIPSSIAIENSGKPQWFLSRNDVFN